MARAADLEEEVRGEWRDLLQADEDSVADAASAPRHRQVVVDLAAAQDDAPDLVRRQQEGLPCCWVHCLVPGVVRRLQPKNSLAVSGTAHLMSSHALLSNWARGQ